MQEKDNSAVQLKRLSADTGFYTNVFKKTEKIVAAIVYILSHTNKRQADNTHIQKIKDRVFVVHESLLETLALQQQEARERLLDFQYELAGLESVLRVGEAGGIISQEVMSLLSNELDLVQRFINNHYTKSDGYSIDINTDVSNMLGTSAGNAKESTSNKQTAPRAPRKQRVQIPAGDISTDAYLVYSQMTDRAERIKTVLDAKPQATIKDIAEVITDVSEKTIQRELNSLIEKGQVVREGERRWSRYSTVKN